MRSPTTLNPADLASLAAFLEDPARPKDRLSLRELYGFLFAVTSAPERVPMSDVLDFVFGDLSGVFTTLDEANQVLRWLMSLYNHVNEGILRGEPNLPPSNPRGIRRCPRR